MTTNPTDPAAEAVSTRTTSDFTIGVSGSDLAPLSIEPAEQKTFEGAAGTKVALPLKLTWRSEGTGKTKLKLGGHPALDNATEVEVDAKAATANVELDLNKHKLPPGTHTLYVRAEGKVKYSRNPEAMKAAQDTKAQAEKSATDASAAAKQAAEKLKEAKAGTDAEKTKTAEKAVADADVVAKAAEQKKTEATKAAADLAPKDTDAFQYSGPIVVKVVAGK